MKKPHEEVFVVPEGYQWEQIFENKLTLPISISLDNSNINRESLRHFYETMNDFTPINSLLGAISESNLNEEDKLKLEYAYDWIRLLFISVSDVVRWQMIKDTRKVSEVFLHEEAKEKEGS